MRPARAGGQMAIAALILALTAQGDVILAEPTTYSGLRGAATLFGRRIVAVETDRQGMLPERFEEACRAHAPRLVYFNPTLQNPTAATMPVRRREELAALAARAGGRIVEDAPCWPLAEGPPPPIAAFAPQHVYYIASLSKCLAPGLRIAFVLVRDARDRERYKEGIAVTPAESFATGTEAVNAIRISLGCIRDRGGRLRAGLQRLSGLLARRPEACAASAS